MRVSLSVTARTHVTLVGADHDAEYPTVDAANQP